MLSWWQNFVLRTRAFSFLLEFQPLILAEVLRELHPRTYVLDLCPSWLVKASREVLGPLLVEIANVSESRKAAYYFEERSSMAFAQEVIA